MHWRIISTETKKIDNYTCYKATTEYVVTNPKGTFKHPVVAWFCPEIPISHGPNGYGGLPGLILEIQIRKTLLGAIKKSNLPSAPLILLSIVKTLVLS